MSTKTSIEWARNDDGSEGLSWNPVVGCDKASPGCDNCYAETIARRFAGSKAFPNGFGVTLHPERLTEPLRRKKPTRYFVTSMGDLFHDAVPADYIAKVFAVMAATPQHSYIILTKRHGRMRSLLRDICTCGSGHPPGVHFGSRISWAASKANPDGVPGMDETMLRGRLLPLPNVVLGVSVESQKWAGIRIPALLETPAAVRALSVEPMLGPIDLSQWMPPIAPVAPEAAPKSWNDWTWGEWVPQPVRNAIEESYGNGDGWMRGPQGWLRNMIETGAPAFGSVVTMDNGFGNNPPQVTGRYVHGWNNIGRLALPDGSFAYTSFGPRTRYEQQAIGWVICGGESGPGARPVHPQWVRSVRDQCVASDVAFFFKQWGSWGPAPFKVPVCNPKDGWQGTAEELAAAKRQSEAAGATHAYAAWAHEEGWRPDEIGHKPWSLERVALDEQQHAPMRRWGKKAAGAELDGQGWTQMPRLLRAAAKTTMTEA